MDERQWLEWVQEDARYKANNIAEHAILKILIADIEQSTEKIMTNHLPHLQECASANAGNIASLTDAVKVLRRWLWIILGIGIIMVLESPETSRVIDIIKGLLQF